MNNQPIGVFDSGVGGLSVLREIKKLLPLESAIFVADQAYVPYGEKTREQLVERVTKIMEFFMAQNVKAVVAACNTATVYTIDEIRKKFNVPVIGTVPVVKTLSKISKTRIAAVFSTPATANSPYLRNLINSFAPDMDIVTVGGTGLEELVEEGITDAPEIQSILMRELPPLVSQGVDAIALGCTHYPFLREQIENIVGGGVTVVDSGGAVARRVREVLTHNNALSEKHSTDSYYTTGDADQFRTAATMLLRSDMPPCAHIDL